MFWVYRLLRSVSIEAIKHKRLLLVFSVTQEASDQFISNELELDNEQCSQIKSDGARVIEGFVSDLRKSFIFFK